MKLLRIQIPVPVGTCDFAGVVRSRAVHTARHALIETSQAFPDCFNDIEGLLTPAAWRTLRYSTPVRWALLCDRSFDPRQELIDLAASAADQGLSCELISADPLDTAAEIRETLIEADPDASKAIWALTSYIQSILHHREQEIVDLAWWEQRVWRDLLGPLGP